ncbi:hypothetical protein DC522_30265 [Microvirga sp. KLBC 81]|jgi:hypothetical protein|uniref:hypothetical protein n=1 Tax=Microvirga sp. KLBC 81 TaxID=1862707 RepID=UPI000D515012|nr:hypothetical protein [Microvirga sp. KLBC 81]PVE20788.1 hypothetical protein DC522_30265 [Microvirga sp. KLBC 81]
MPDTPDTKHDPISSGSPKAHSPGRKGGNPVQNAEKWGGGSKGSKGPTTSTDKHNPNSSAKS